MEKISVKASGSYDIIIEDGILNKTGKLVAPLVKGRHAVIVTDDIVDALYSERVAASLKTAGFEVNKFVIANGEASKNAENYVNLLEFCAEKRVSRKDVLVALGGGVVGDLTGFAAATFLRGIAFVQLPTTLLAAVDSSVGGKTAIDLKAGKNLAGAFYQPKIVLCDCTTFKTLPEETFADGMAEVIKYGAIADKELWGWLEGDMAETNIEKIVARCVSIKRDVVEEDEFDTGLRQILNFGHTAGHSVEALSNFAVTHGSAVAIGMALMTKISVNEGYVNTNEDIYKSMVNMLKKYKLPFTTEYSAEQLVGPMRSDKKGDGGSVNLILLKNIGECFIQKTAYTDVENMLKKVVIGG